MSQISSSLPPGMTEMQYQTARQFLYRCLRKRLFGFTEEDVQDATQDATLRLIRFLRREEARNLDALLNVICQRTAVDVIRSKRRGPALVPIQEDTPDEETPDHPAVVTPKDDLPGVSNLDRLRFLVLEFFRGSEVCLKLARAYFDQRNWKEVAEEIRSSHAAVRQQWSRCVAKLRAVARQSPDFILQWAEES